MKYFVKDKAMYCLMFRLLSYDMIFFFFFFLTCQLCQSAAVESVLLRDF